MQKSINGATFRKMIMVAEKILNSNQKYIDSLNVFPVPDGDTGKNMWMTFKAACTAVVESANNNLDTLGEALGKGALRGARGNSGVILSQILRGMANEIVLNTEMTTKSFAKAMKNGAQMAYKAVTVPKEGTILTVIRIMADAAESSAKKHADFEEFFEDVLNAGEQALAQTPELLPVLKAAGVVDAGGRGLVIIFTGLCKGLTSDEDFDFEVKPDETLIQIQKNEEFHVNYMDLAEIQFGYCTEFKVIQMKSKTTESDIDKLREKLMEIGDCVICIGDLSLVKVHVHTNEPNRALTYALELGEIWDVKIDNMVQQNRELKEKQLKANKNTKAYGIVTIASGRGVADVFKDLGADEIIEGGQTMNPSADDIVKAVERVPSDHVFVFPNNKNIILAAEQAQNLTKKNIHVIPSVSIPEGIS
ncbi:MAG: DAK2 domain-containing protein, partial [Clostridia bacterium]|nr:DAK2 domain-containing protein [Clostridia bacterium]